MDVADMLIDKIFSWVDLQKESAKKLNELATALEEHKKNVNISQVAGSVGSVVGAVGMTAAGVAAFFTAGLAIPVIAAGGAIVSGLGFATSVGSETANIIISSSTMKDAKVIEEKIEDLEKEIQKLMETPKKEGRKREQQASGCADVLPDVYVMERILRTMAKRNGLELQKGISLFKMMPGFSKHKISGEDTALSILKKSALGLGLLSKFVIETAAKTSGEAVMPKLLPHLATSLGSKAAAKTLGRVAGGAVGLVFSVPELVINCMNLDKCETEASQSLREKAKAIQSASETFEKELDEIQKAFQRLAKVKSSIEKTKRSAAEREILIEFAKEICQDETVLQRLGEQSVSEVILKLVDMFYLLKKKIDEEEKENHSNDVDITFLAHGAITDSMIPASRLLPLPTITDVLLYSPWNCYLGVDAAYDIATGLMKPEHRDFQCSGENCKIPDKKHWPTNLPNCWNSLKEAGDKLIPNIVLSPVKKPGDGAWESFEFLTNKHGKPGRNHIIIPYIIPGEKNSGSSDRVPFFIVTLAMSLVLLFSRFQATVHLTACLGKISSRQKLDKEYLEQQYAYTINHTSMGSSRSAPSCALYRAECENVKLINILKTLFG